MRSQSNHVRSKIFEDLGVRDHELSSNWSYMQMEGGHVGDNCERTPPARHFALSKDG